MNLYRYSPLKQSSECLEVLSYIDEQLKKLAEVVLGSQLPINTLKIFSHYDDEFAFLKQWIDSQGDNDGTTTPSYYVRLSQPLTINNDKVDYIGIRTPDPYRSQVGCGDFVVDDYEAFRTHYLGSTPFVREIQHPKYEMLELFHPDFDVLGYVVKDSI